MEKNPNNLKIFKVILNILCDYKSQKSLDILKKFTTYHVDHKPYDYLLKNIQKYYEFIIKIGLNTDTYNIIISNLDIELHKLFINIDIKSEYSFNEDCIHLKFINLPDYDDISLLNRNFDRAIQIEIENGSLDFDDYIDSLDKLVIGFRANPDAKVA